MSGKLQEQFPLFWNALKSGEIRRAQGFILSNVSEARLATPSSAAERKRELSRRMRTKYPRFWKAIKSGEFRSAHGIFSDMCAGTSVQKALSPLSGCEDLHPKQRFYVDGMLPSDCDQETKEELIQRIRLLYPDFWIALLQGEMTIAKSFFKKMCSKHGDSRGRKNISEEMQLRFPLFWKALRKGEVLHVDHMIKSIILNRQTGRPLSATNNS
jgi:hypothetical protein